MKWERLNRADEVQREIQNTNMALRYNKDRGRKLVLLERLGQLYRELRVLGHRTEIQHKDVETLNREWQAKQERKEKLRRMPYAQYLQTPEWQKRRKQMLKKVDYKCQLCNSPERLNVHHRDYTRRGSERDTDLIVLCENCHHRFHKESRLK